VQQHGRIRPEGRHGRDLAGKALGCSARDDLDGRQVPVERVERRSLGQNLRFGPGVRLPWLR